MQFLIFIIIIIYLFIFFCFCFCFFFLVCFFFLIIQSQVAFVNCLYVARFTIVPSKTQKKIPLLLLLTELTILTYLQFISIKNIYFFKHENEALVPVLHQIKCHTFVLSLNSLDSLGLLSSSCNECSPEVNRMKLLFQFKSQFTLRAL